MALASDFTAGKVLEEMKGAQLATFVAGIVEGLATARYLRDGKNPEGMECIFNWFYETDGVMVNVEQVFTEFADYTPGFVIAVMVQEECGA